MINLRRSTVTRLFIHTARSPMYISKQETYTDIRYFPCCIHPWKITRRERNSPCKYEMFPEEWFTFFHTMTGVSGGHLLLFGIWNFLVSKEYFIRDIGYIRGVAIIAIADFLAVRYGTTISMALDKEVDAVVEEMYEYKRKTLENYESVIKEAELAQWRAEGQKYLIEAKKENVAMQLETEYRNRLMHVYQSVKDRMDYHVNKYYAEARIHQKSKVNWVIKAVLQSITPELAKEVLNQSLRDLDELARRTSET